MDHISVFIINLAQKFKELFFCWQQPKKELISELEPTKHSFSTSSDEENISSDDT